MESHGSCRAQKSANPAGAFRYKITYICRHKYFLGTSRRTWKSWSTRRKGKYLNIAINLGTSHPSPDKNVLLYLFLVCHKCVCLLFKIKFQLFKLSMNCVN